MAAAIGLRCAVAARVDADDIVAEGEAEDPAQKSTRVASQREGLRQSGEGIWGKFAAGGRTMRAVRRSELPTVSMRPPEPPFVR